MGKASKNSCATMKGVLSASVVDVSKIPETRRCSGTYA